ncbi:cyclin-dependent kinase 5 activator 1-like [Pseudophryne corroboree]|uniref:cyclin-dependent kinase 5 activator 1-like n=1 Tax=Pseudophryne corroboree TaxID=495146 RepID=UPI003081F8D5
MWNCLTFSCCHKASRPDEDSSNGNHRTNNSETARPVERHSLIAGFRRFMVKRRQGKMGGTNITHLVIESMKDSVLSCMDLSAFIQDSHDAPVKETGNNQEVRSPEKSKTVQASTSELLSCLMEFLCRRCKEFQHISPTDIALWMTAADSSLSECWQMVGFITLANVVFLYMLCQEVMSSELHSMQELMAYLSTCLYLSYAYNGSETSYPLRSFLAESSKEAFWSHCLYIINLMSAKMLHFHTAPQYFNQVFEDLKAEGGQQDITSV